MTTVRSCVLAGTHHDELHVLAFACPSCQRGLVRHLAEIEMYLDILGIIGPAPLRTGGHGPISRQYESREPVRLDVLAMLDPRTEINGASGAINPDGIEDDVLDEIPNVRADLGGWARVLMEENLDAIPRGGGWAAFLRSWVSWIVGQPWVDEFAQDVTRVHGALRAACKDQPQRPVADCPCGGLLFRRSDDPVDPRLRCSACGTTYDGFQLLTLRGTA